MRFFFLVASLLVLGAVCAACGVSAPDVIQRELASTPGGQMTVITFIDFECPFCRTTHSQLSAVLAPHHGKVRVVRRHVPLAMHSHADVAARASVCADALSTVGDDMADALFDAPPETLTEPGCVEIAERLGIDRARFTSCLGDPQTAARIRADVAMFGAAGGDGVPLLWIGDRRLDGAQDHETLERAVKDALSRR